MSDRPGGDNASRNLRRHTRSARLHFGATRDWSGPWDSGGRTNPNRPPPTRTESDAGAIEASIAELAGAIRRGVEAGARPAPRDARTGRIASGACGPELRWGASAGARAERDAIAYLTAAAFGLSLADLCRQMGFAVRSTASRSRRSGERLVRESRARNEAAW